MTKEEKAKAYDKALERARKIHDEILNNELLGFPGQIEDIFPELRDRESEDERIRKVLLNLVSNDKAAGYTKFYEERGITCDDAIAYIEKQKEDYSSFSEEQRKYMEKYTPLDKVTLVKLLAERDMNVAAVTKSFNECFPEEKQLGNECNEHELTADAIRAWNSGYEKGYDVGYANGKNAYLEDEDGAVLDKTETDNAKGDSETFAEHYGCLPDPPQEPAPVIVGAAVYEELSDSLALAFSRYLDSHMRKRNMCLSAMESQDILYAFRRQDWKTIERYRIKCLFNEKD